MYVHSNYRACCCQPCAKRFFCFCCMHKCLLTFGKIYCYFETVLKVEESSNRLNYDNKRLKRRNYMLYLIALSYISPKRKRYYQQIICHYIHLTDMFTFIRYHQRRKGLAKPTLNNNQMFFNDLIGTNYKVLVSYPLQ